MVNAAGAAVRSLEAREKTKCLQVRFLNHIFGIFLVSHQPTSQVVCVIHERQHKSFKARASMLVIHGRRQLYDKVIPAFDDIYSHSLPGIAIGIIPGRKWYVPIDGGAPARRILSTRIQKQYVRLHRKQYKRRRRWPSGG
jgi:hypothetical protein